MIYLINEGNNSSTLLQISLILDVITMLLLGPISHLKESNSSKSPRRQNIRSKRKENPSENLKSIVGARSKIKEAATRSLASLITIATGAHVGKLVVDGEVEEFRDAPAGEGEKAAAKIAAFLPPSPEPEGDDSAAPQPALSPEPEPVLFKPDARVIACKYPRALREKYVRLLFEALMGQMADAVAGLDSDRAKRVRAKRFAAQQALDIERAAYDGSVSKNNYKSLCTTRILFIRNPLR